MSFLKEGNYGYLERIAFFAFAFGMAGMALTVIAMNLFDDRSSALWILAIWFAPVPLCVICWWSVAAKDDFQELSGLLAALCTVGAFTGESGSLLGIPILIAFSFLLGLFHEPARRIINRGRTKYRRI